jgi:hypothetical protein
LFESETPEVKAEVEAYLKKHSSTTKLEDGNAEDANVDDDTQQERNKQMQQ